MPCLPPMPTLLDADGDGFALADAAADALALAIGAPEAFGGVVLRGPYAPERTAELNDIAGYRRIPLNADASALLGGLDLSASLAAGKARTHKGLLAEGEGPIIVPSAERLQVEAAAMLALFLDGSAEGFDGAPLPPRALLVLDEAEGEDAPIDPRLSERLAFIVPSSTPLTLERELPSGWRATRVPDAIAEALAAAALMRGLFSMRIAIHLVLAAKALAALRGRAEVTGEDAARAAALILAPRAPPPADLQDNDPPESEEQETEPPQQPPQDPDGEDADRSDDPPKDKDLSQDERVVEAVNAAIDAAVLEGLSGQRRPGARVGRVGAQTKGGRGRPAGVRAGTPRGQNRLALVETLSAALPYQRIRQRSAAPGKSPRIAVRADDLRIRRQKAKAATLTVFCVDASGSQAFARMAEAKGAVETLLAASYARRDAVALVAFRKDGAEVLLPPTQSLVRAKRALAALPAGGATPLAAGLAASLALCQRSIRDGREPTLVLLTDGRGNIALDGSRPSRMDRWQSARDAARPAARGVAPPAGRAASAR
ncbi:MAG: VWA domain-containing protein, partial [Pseudomonadota bacterium]